MTGAPAAVTGEAFGAAFATPLDEDQQTPEWLADEPPAAPQEPAPPAAPSPAGGQPTPPEQQPAPAGGEQQPTPQPSEPQQPPAPQEPAQPEQAPQPTPPAEGTQEPQPGQQPQPSDEQPLAQEPPLLGGRFKSTEEVLDAYQNLRPAYDRVQNQLHQERLARQRLEQQFEQVRPHLEQLQTAQRAQALGEKFDLSQLDGQQIAALLDQTVRQEVGQSETRIRQEVEQEITSRTLAETVQGFMGSHPDVLPDGPLDLAIGEIVTDFQTDPADGQQKQELFPIHAANLEIAYQLAKEPQLRTMVIDLDVIPNERNLALAQECLQNPALAQEFLANPVLIDTDQGVAKAKQQAQMNQAYSQAVTQAGVQGAQPSPEMARRAAHVETGGAGAPIPGTPGAQPEDEFDVAMQTYEKGRASNAFGLPVVE